MLELTVTDLHKRYGRRGVLSGLSLKAAGGRVLVVTGPNGSGKSTLLRCLAGLERPSRGTVRWADAERTLERPERRDRIGYLSPELTLYEELTGLENLIFFTRMRGHRPDVPHLKVLLDRVGLAGRGEDRTGDYSSGMRQRLKWAFALAGGPDALLLDEPGVTLDAVGFALAGELIREAKERGTLVVLATNDTREMELGDDRLAIG